MKINILAVSPFSCSVEITSYNEIIVDKLPNINVHAYYSPSLYDVYINNNIVLKNYNKNVFSLYELTPNTPYKLRIVNAYIDETICFNTSEVSEIKEITYKDNVDYTILIQDTLDNLLPNGALIINKGEYLISSIFLRSNKTLYLKKDARLIATTDRTKFKVLEPYQNNFPLGTWEGEPNKMYAGVISIINEEHVNLIGEGVIDGDAINGDWWINHKKIKVATRPRDIFMNKAKDVLIVGVTIKNSPSWTIHPFYSEQIKLINLEIENPKVSPNTDGCNPESCNNVSIIGCHFSVGDDCIAIKSGKKIMADNYYKPCEKITIRNCFMENGHGAIVLGSEMSCGIKDLEVTDCLFINTDRGLRIKTRRGRGDKAIIDNITFENIIMDKVLNPFVINMFYYCDADGKSDYVQNKDVVNVSKETPYLGNFYFKNIYCTNTYVSSAFIYGLPEQKINQLTFENVEIEMKPSEICEYPAMMCDIKKVNRMGIYINNVSQVITKNLTVKNQIGDKISLENVDIFDEEK